jgi:hypothetical protein
LEEAGRLKIWRVGEHHVESVLKRKRGFCIASIAFFFGQEMIDREVKTYFLGKVILMHGYLHWKC